MKQCNYPRCGKLTEGYYCPQHLAMTRVNARRQWHNNRRWKKASRLFLKKNPLCIHCKQKGITTAATHTDHIVPVGYCHDPFDSSNWQPLCISCHNVKTLSDKKKYK